MEERTLWVWIDGALRAPGEARIGVLDRGFLYGDTVYETLRTYQGRVFAEEDHLARLENSAAALGIDLPGGGREALRRVTAALVEAGPSGGEVGVRLTLSRGEGPLGLDATHCRHPRLVGYAWTVPPGRHPSVATGVDGIISSVRRNPPCALDPRIKSGNFLNNILAYREAQARGAFEAILLSTDGTVAEATTSNVFWVRGGEVRTPAPNGILHGITRAHVLVLLAEHRIPCREGGFSPADLLGAEEAFLTSTLKGVLPLKTLDGKQVGSAVPGPITSRLLALFDAHVGIG